MQNFIRLAAETTQEPPDNQSLIILITGFVVVFLVLLLLIGLIKVYSGIVCAAQNKATSKSKSKEPQQVKVTPVEAIPAVAPSASDEVDLQTIAVITAAVEAFYGGTNKVRVAGIRRAASGRSAWGNAGVVENIPSMTRGGLL